MNFLGPAYLTTDKNTKNLMVATQRVIKAAQDIACTSVVPMLIYNVQQMPEENPLQSSNDMKINMKANVIDPYIDFAFNQQRPGTQPVSEMAKRNFRNALFNLIDVSVDASTVDGKIDQKVLKVNITNALKSFCAGKSLGTYTPPPVQAAKTILYGQEKVFPIFIKSKPHVMNPGDQYNHNLKAENNFNDNVFNISVNFSQVSKSPKSILTITTINTDGSINQNKEIPIGYVNNLTETSIGNHIFMMIRIAPSDTSVIITEMDLKLTPVEMMGTKSNFGSVSHFGKSETIQVKGGLLGGGMTILPIFLIILLLAGGLYYLNNKGKLKIPTFNQRMAQFGRTIKSLRGRR